MRSNAEKPSFFSNESKGSIEAAEISLPLINHEESRFIENAGRQYQGFVDRADGGRKFQDVFIGHCAYYDSLSRAVVEAVVTTEAVNDKGGNELKSPTEVRRYQSMIVYRSETGDILEKPRAIIIGGVAIADGNLYLRAVRHVALRTHLHLMEHVANVPPAKLEEQGKTIVAEMLSLPRSER